MGLSFSNLSDIETVWIDPAVREHPLVGEIRRRLPGATLETGFPPSLTFPVPLEKIKKNLFITRGRGHRIKPCPGSRGRICCGYWIINAMLHCPMDCHYCVLQSYLSVPAMTIDIDEGVLRDGILHRLAQAPEHIFRFGTGELGDSLVHDALTGFSRRFIPFFAHTRNGILELKTKTAMIENLEGLDPKGHTVIAWSVNPPEIVGRIEPKTAPLKQRIKAARRCQEMGYWVGLHFDPVLYFEGWEPAYHRLISRLSSTLDPERIIWISLAAFRYTRRQKEIIRQRFPNTPLFWGEFFRDEDGKFRYLQRLRIQMYQKITAWLRQWSPRLFIYFCMENQRAWEATFPSPPRNTRELDERFNRHIWRLLGR